VEGLAFFDQNFHELTTEKNTFCKTTISLAFQPQNPENKCYTTNFEFKEKAWRMWL